MGGAATAPTIVIRTYSVLESHNWSLSKTAPQTRRTDQSRNRR
jgi:hypothetical protein